MKILKMIWNDFERWTSLLLISFLTIILFIEVLNRYIFYKSIGWIGEVSSFAFVWFIYLSMSHITGKNQHIRVQILDFILPPKWLKYVDLPMNAVWLAFNVLMTFYGVQLVLSVIEYPFKTPVLDMSMAIPYSIIPLAFGLMSIRLLLIMIKDLKNWSRT